MAVAEGGEDDGEDGEAVEQVVAEAAGGDHRGEVAVGGGDPPDVGADGLAAADAFEAALLHDAQELGLEGGGELADLVEEEGAALGELDAAALAGAGVGEGALLVADCNGDGVYVSGGFSGSVDFDPSAGTAMSTFGGTQDPFALALTAAGAPGPTRTTATPRTSGWTATTWSTCRSTSARTSTPTPAGEQIIAVQESLFSKNDVLLETLRPGTGDW